MIDLKEEEQSVYKDEYVEDETFNNEEEIIEETIIEAKFVAKKIKELIETGFAVSNKNKTTRPITYKDIAILLRSTKSQAAIYEQEISRLNIPVFCDTSSRIFGFNRNTSGYEFT